jgi:hypothetical protein
MAINYSSLAGVSPIDVLTRVFPGGVPPDWDWGEWLKFQPPGTKDPRSSTNTGTNIGPGMRTFDDTYGPSPYAGGPYKAPTPGPLGRGDGPPPPIPGRNAPGVPQPTPSPIGRGEGPPPPPQRGSAPGPGPAGAPAQAGLSNSSARWRARYDARNPQAAADADLPDWLRNQWTQGYSGGDGGDGSAAWSAPGNAIMDSQGRSVVLLNDDGSLTHNDFQWNEGAEGQRRFDPELGWVTDRENVNQNDFDSRMRRNRAIALSIVAGGALAGATGLAGAAGAGEAGSLGLTGGGTVGTGAGATGGAGLGLGGPGTGVTFLGGGSAGVGAGATGAVAPSVGSSWLTLGNAGRAISALGGLGSALGSGGTNTVVNRSSQPAGRKSAPQTFEGDYYPVEERGTPRGVGTAVGAYAEGGPILGPGGPRDDNLIIAASNGEYVIPADVVLRKGTEFFDKLKEKVREETGGMQEGGPPPAAPPSQPSPVMGFSNGGYVRRYADGGYVEEDPLAASASPGLETLPGTAPMAPPLFTASGSANGMEMAAPPPEMPPPVQAPPPAASSGTLGLPEPKSRTDEDREYIDGMPLMKKIGLLLQSYQAGVEGRPNPFEQELQVKRKREADFRQELATTLEMTKKGMELVRSMPEGKARDALIEQYARASGKQGDMVKSALQAVGGKDEREFREVLATLDNPAARNMLINAAGGDPITARKLLADGDFMKRLDQRADQVTLPAVTGKMSVLARAMEKVDRLKGPDGKVTFTMADLRAENEKLPKEMRLTDGELATANRNQAALIAYGLKTDTTLQKEQEAAGKKAESGTWSEPYRLNGATVQKNSVTGEIKTAVAREAREPQAPAPTVVEIKDPVTGKNIKIDAKTGLKIGDSPEKAAAERNIPAPVLTALATNEGNARRAQMAFDLLSGNDVKLKGPDGKEIVLKGDKDATGWKGFMPDALLQRADEAGVDVRAVIADLSSMVIHDRSGAAVTAAEFPRLRPFIPSDKDEPAAARRKLGRFIAEYQMVNDEIRGMFTEEQGYRQPPPKKKEEAPKAETPAGVPAGSKPIGYAPDGKRVWQDASGKKWKE